MRVVAKLIGGIVEHGKQVVAETLKEVLAAAPQARRAPSMPPATVPAALRDYQVDSTPAASYDALLLGTD